MDGQLTSTAATRSEIATEVLARREEIARVATDRVYAASVFWDIRYGPQGRVSSLNDNLKNLDVFALAIRNNSPMIVETHAEWLRDTYIKLGMCTTFLSQALAHLQEAALEVLKPETARALSDTIDIARYKLSYSDPLSRQIIQHQDAIVAAVTKRMYGSSPFWMAKYGEPGRKSCMIDVFYNIAFMVDALATNTLVGFTKHATWLRGFLITRGMCSAYYIDSLKALAEEMSARVTPEYRSQVTEALSTIISGLYDNHPFAVAVRQQGDYMLNSVLTTVYDRDPSLKARISREVYADDLRYKLSYLTDAAARDNGETFIKHLTWLRGSLPHFSLTAQDYNRQLDALAAVLPPQTPPQAHQWLKEVRANVQSVPQSEAIASAAPGLATALIETLHAPRSVWSAFVPASRHAEWRAVLETAITYAIDALPTGNAQSALEFLNNKVHAASLSPAYVVDFALTLPALAERTLPTDVSTGLRRVFNSGLETLAENDPAFQLLTANAMLESITVKMRGYSPYWQADYQRRTQVDMIRDLRALVGFLVNELMEENKIAFDRMVEQQRRYMIAQGICTAYYQQMVDLVVEGLKPLLDPETAEDAARLLGAANDTLQSHDPRVTGLTDHQDEIVDAVIAAMNQNQPDWTKVYPDGEASAVTDLYFWLAYLTDAIHFNNAAVLAAHVYWLYQYNRMQGGTGDHVRVALVALGHAIRQYVPQHSAEILTLMQQALAKVSN